MRKTLKRRGLGRPVLQAHPKYQDQKKDVPVVLVRPRNKELWTKDPNLKTRVKNDLQEIHARSYLIEHASELSHMHVTVGRQRL